MVDTSVVIAGIAAFHSAYESGHNASADFLYEWFQAGHFVWLVSDEILEEYREVAMRKRIRRHAIGRLLNLLSEGAEIIRPRGTTALSPDPKDDAFCLCAEQGEADFVVTLNPRDFPQEKLTARVVSPTEFSGRKKTSRHRRV